jgi:hypothetical protein
VLNVLLARLSRCFTSQAIRAAISAADAITYATEAAPGTFVRRSADATAADVCKLPGLLPNQQVLIAADRAAAGRKLLLNN